MKRVFLSMIPAMFIVIFLASFSCTNYNELDLYGVVDCDTTDITWESTIADILAENCVRCHGPAISYNGVRHDSYEAELIVVNDGRLRGVVNHLPGYPQMPFDGPKLPECELLQINTWLDNGAPEK